VSFISQLIGSALGLVWAVAGGLVVYGVLRASMGLRLTPEEEHEGADLSIHQISATPERETTW
jgi:Amt family ammonium transporter